MNDKCIHKIDIKAFLYCKECAVPICLQCKTNHKHIQSLIPLEVYINELKSSFTVLTNQIDNITNFQSIYNNFATLRETFNTFCLNLDDCYNETSSLIANTSLASITLNAKDSLNSLKLLSEKDDNYLNDLIELRNRLKESMDITKSTDKIVTQFNINLEDFSIGLNMLLKYTQERQIHIENYYLMNNCHINDFIKDKIQEDNSELRQRIELLEIENKKLYQMSRSTHDSFRPQNSLPQSSNRTIIDYAKDEKDIIELIQKGLVDNIVNQTHYSIIEQYDLRSIVTMSFQQLNNLIKIEEFNESFYASEEVLINTLNNKGISEHIYQSTIFQSFINGVIDVMKCEIMHYLFTIKSKLLQGIEDAIIRSYLKASKSIKKLKAIDLKGTGLTENNMSRVALVANNTYSTELYLQNNKIKDSGVRILFSNLNEGNKLKNIYLNNNSLTKASLITFKEAVAYKPNVFENLKIINFENNNITNDKGTKDILLEIRKLIKSTIHI